MHIHSSRSSSEGRQLQGWHKRLKVTQKIGLGYALLVGIIVTGTGAGITIAQQYERKAYKGNEDAIEEILSIKELESSIHRFIAYERQLITWFNDPETLLVNYDLYRASGRDFQEDWLALQQQYEQDIAAGIEETEEELELLGELIENYSGVISNNLDEVDRFIKGLDLGNLEGQALVDARQAFIELNQRPTAIKLAEFGDKLDNLSDFIENDEVREAQAIVRTSAQLQLQIILVSVLISLALAGWIAYVISRTINRPLQILEETALQVTQDENFKLRAAVINNDEIGSLAESFNQLIEWIGDYTSALRLTKQDLEKQAQELNAIIDNLGSGLLVTDSKGRITRANPALRKMLSLQDIPLRGQPVAAVLTANITELIAKNQTDPRSTFIADINLIENRLGQALVTAILAEKESQAPLQSNGSIMLVRDITAEKEIDQMKTDFLSMVSHELRTPLTSVLGFTKLIQKKFEETILPDVSSDARKTKRAVRQVRENLNIIVSEGERLTSLINDVLDISKIEAGKIEWNMQPTDTPDIIERAISAVSVLAQNSGLEVGYDLAANLPQVMCDRDRLMQVVINLLSNAIKFTDSGTITCRTHQQENMVVISVIDTGIGLSPDDLEKVFDKFTQVGELMTDKPKGTGLGLPICKQIVEHYGGHIWAESEPGRGSTFSFTLPIVGGLQPDPDRLNLQTLVQRLKKNVEQAVTPSEHSQKTILVVDDEPHIRELLTQELESAGYQVRTAKDGMDGLNQIKAAPPDLIILDVMMPNINGFDLAAVLKNNPATMGIPTIVLSIIQDKERGHRLGADRYLSKPIDTDVLLRDIKTLLDQGTSHRQVLVVDIDTSTTKTLTDVLLSKGYTVTQSTIGKDGLQKALAVQPDMIIVDSAISVDHDRVNTLRFENGMETIFIIVVEQT